MEKIRNMMYLSITQNNYLSTVSQITWQRKIKGKARFIFYSSQSRRETFLVSVNFVCAIQITTFISVYKYSKGTVNLFLKFYSKIMASNSWIHNIASRKLKNNNTIFKMCSCRGRVKVFIKVWSVSTCTTSRFFVFWKYM